MLPQAKGCQEPPGSARGEEAAARLSLWRKHRPASGLQTLSNPLIFNHRERISSCCPKDLVCGSHRKDTILDSRCEQMGLLGSAHLCREGAAMTGQSMSLRGSAPSLTSFEPTNKESQTRKSVC